MREHYHTSIDNILVTTLMVIIGLNVVRFGASKAANSSNANLAAAGKAIGALVSFP